MADQHEFYPSTDDPRICGQQVSGPGSRWGGQTCGLPRSNARVHAPGVQTTPTTPDRHLTVVPSIDEPAVFVRGNAGGTEVRAASVARLGRGRLRIQIAHVLYHPSRRDSGRTFDEIKADLRMPDRHSSITSAVRSLVLAGLAEALTDDEGATVTRPSGSGVPSTAWVLTPAGLAACAATPQEEIA